MNSAEGYKGFVTFLLLLGIILTATLSLSYVIEPDSSSSKASETKTQPLELKVNNVSFDEAEIVWITEDETTSKIYYATNWSSCSNLENTSCLSESSNVQSTSHQIKITGLKGDTSYFVKVQAGEDVYPKGSPLTFKTQPLSQSGIIAPVEIIHEEPQKSTESDYDGIENVKEAKDLKPIDNAEGVLGVETTFQEPIDPLSQINELVVDEFRDALIYNDLRYDFNNDGNVTSKDYPLFLEFILNQED